jgi:hypothetical protein
MSHKGGRIGFTPIDWFNGGLFEDDSALPVTAKDVEELILGGGGPICLRKGLPLMAPPPAKIWNHPWEIASGRSLEPLNLNSPPPLRVASGTTE